MSISTSLHHRQIVDNPRRYTRQEARNGGIVSGASRRFEARNRHAEIRRLRAMGRTLRQIAGQVGYHASTVSRILSGKIRTCLNRAETLATTVLRELSPTPPMIPPTPKRRRRFDPFGGGIPKPGDSRYAGFLAGVRLYDSTHAVSIPKCDCGAEIVRRSQVCPVCGRQPGEQTGVDNSQPGRRESNGAQG